MSLVRRDQNPAMEKIRALIEQMVYQQEWEAEHLDQLSNRK